MRTRNYLVMGLLALGMLSFTACDDSNNNDDEDDDTIKPELTTIINNYVDKVVLPTYKEMKEKSWALLDKVEKFDESGAQADLDAVCTAWRELRRPWEKSEAFLFGPANEKQLDPSLDSWPLDQIAIDNYVSSAIDISYETLRDGLNVNVKGFHTIEYLVFEDGQPKKVNKLTERQHEYLNSVTSILRDDCIKLWVCWNGEDNIPERDQEILDDLEFAFGGYAKGYGYYFKNPEMNNPFKFKTQVDVLNQIVDGCTDICGEVGEQKIGEPYNEQNVYKVESWYSWNSLDDYEDNVISIENSYAQMTEYVKGKNEALDTEIKSAIDIARKAIRAIPAPFRSNLNAKTEIENAQAKLASLESSLEKLKAVW